MNALAKLGRLVGLACLSCGALQATQYLVTIQAENGQYLCAENGGGSSLVANRNSAGSWETFVIDDTLGSGNGWSFSIKSTANPKFLSWGDPELKFFYDGHYFNAYIRNPSLVINRDYAGSWETFHFVDPWGAGSSAILGSGSVYTKIATLPYGSITSYLQAAGGGGGAVGGMGGDYANTTIEYLSGWTGTRFTITVLAVL